MTSGLRWTEEQLAAHQKRHHRRPQTSAPTTQTRASARPESELERRFAQQLVAHAVAPPVREYYFVKDRDFRLDFAWPACRLAVEIQGAAHRIKGKFKADLEKRALALLAGWRVLELGRDQVRNEQGVEWVKQLLG